ncbi:MFS general substrate transporter [Ganoderma sinense ZZ0214-1]|uniref:MFS general substrate transporter n=1 Tax=Ganoderma sinense ZZ0214-1 TaxID=1077348 RepID=A0A2G8SBL7_9APHY|nr:MFS general substrate transporter [Ganoderma sinense ZZ0214-1]
MVFGILEDHKLDNVPGTGLLSDRGRVCAGTTDGAADLKRGTGRYSDIILIPQPSDDPRDPLNWPRWKKEACFWTLVFATSLVGALFPIATSGYVLLSKEFGVSVDNVASSFSSYLPALAVSLLLQNTLAVKYGHRIVYLSSTLLMFIACCWTALSPDLVSIRVSRVFQGFGMAASQALVPTTMEQIYFVHERGSRSTIWNFATLAAETLSPFIYGYVIQNLSWQLGFWFVSIAFGLLFVMTLFFVPETTFPPSSSKSPQGERAGTTVIKEIHQPNEVLEKHVDRASVLPAKPPPFLSQLRIYNGTFSDENLWKIFMRPFPLVLSPVTWFIFWSFMMQAFWFSLLSLCASTIFTISYHFNPAQIGLTHLGGLIGVILGMLVTGPLSDWAIVWMSQRNRGVYEPEYRLVFMLSTLVGMFGYIGWAIGSDNSMPWIGAVSCFAMVTFGLVVSGGAAVTYLLDTHGANALHILSITDFAKNLILYGVAFVANSVVAARGVKVALLILGACQALCLLASVPMYVYGKRVRSFASRMARSKPDKGRPRLNFDTLCLICNSITDVSDVLSFALTCSALKTDALQRRLQMSPVTLSSPEVVDKFYNFIMDDAAARAPHIYGLRLPRLKLTNATKKTTADRLVAILQCALHLKYLSLSTAGLEGPLLPAVVKLSTLQELVLYAGYHKSHYTKLLTSLRAPLRHLHIKEILQREMTASFVHNTLSHFAPTLDSLELADFTLDMSPSSVTNPFSALRSLKSEVIRDFDDLALLLRLFPNLDHALVIEYLRPRSTDYSTIRQRSKEAQKVHAWRGLDHVVMGDAMQAFLFALQCPIRVMDLDHRITRSEVKEYLVDVLRHNSPRQLRIILDVSGCDVAGLFPVEAADRLTHLFLCLSFQLECRRDYEGRRDRQPWHQFLETLVNSVKHLRLTHLRILLLYNVLRERGPPPGDVDPDVVYFARGEDLHDAGMSFFGTMPTLQYIFLTTGGYTILSNRAIVHRTPYESRWLTSKAWRITDANACESGRDLCPSSTELGTYLAREISNDEAEAIATQEEMQLPGRGRERNLVTHCGSCQ